MIAQSERTIRTRDQSLKEEGRWRKRNRNLEQNLYVEVEFAYFHTRFLKFDHLEWWVGNAKQVGCLDVSECEGLVHDDDDFDGGPYIFCYHGLNWPKFLQAASFYCARLGFEPFAYKVSCLRLNTAFAWVFLATAFNHLHISKIFFSQPRKKTS